MFNYDVGLMPYRRGLDVVVGRPIEVVQQEKPEQGYVDEVHARYIRELERLWGDVEGCLCEGAGGRAGDCRVACRGWVVGRVEGGLSCFFPHGVGLRVVD